MPDISLLLEGARQGSRAAVDQLFALLYPEFRQIAHNRLRKSAPLTLVETTILVNESYLRMVRTGRLAVNDRVHFLAYTARMMRSIIVDLVRERVTSHMPLSLNRISLTSGAVRSWPICMFCADSASWPWGIAAKRCPGSTPPG